jgi:arylsulfatase A-like enzyme
MFVYWNGKIKPGSMSGLPVSTIDILPTICAVTNTPLPEKEIDGRNISPVFTDSNIDTVPLFWHFPHYRGNDVVPYSIIRDGEWKLIKRYEGEEFELYNLKNDLSEATDLAKDNPEKVNELNNKLNEWLKLSNSKLPIVKTVN